jgi:hypothetical protein
MDEIPAQPHMFPRRNFNPPLYRDVISAGLGVSAMLFVSRTVRSTAVMGVHADGGGCIGCPFAKRQN